MSTSFYPGYLYAWVFWLSMALGCLGLLILHHVLRARWSRAVLPVLEAGAATLPLLMLLYVPVLLGGMVDLYPWAGAHAEDPIAAHRAPYLNMPFFVARYVVFFMIWSGMAWYLIRSRRLHGDAPEAAQARSNFGSAGLVVFVLTVTFAMTDWVMTLEKHWGSTIFGVWFIAGQALGALVLATLWYARRSDAAAETRKDLGNLMLAFTLFWAYISVSQYLITWSGNLPEEASYYLRRSNGGWNGLGGVLIVGHFLLPFLVLLSGKTKRSPILLSSVAAWLLLMRALDVYWIVVPSARPGSVMPTVLDVAVFAVLGAVWMLAYASQLRGSLRDRPVPAGSTAHA